MALAIEAGAHPKAIQTRMGHSSINVTFDRYGHLFPELDERIADGLDAAWSRALAVSPRPERGLAVIGGDPASADSQSDQHIQGWARRDSNSRPPPCKGGALAS